MIQVTAVIHPSKFESLETLVLTKNKIQLELTYEDWKEIQAVLQGKRKRVSSEEMDGYYPKTIIVFNDPK